MKRLAFALVGLAACSTDTFTGGADSGTDAVADAPSTEGGGGEGGSCATPPACAAVQACNAFDDTQAKSYAPFFDGSQAPGSLAFSTDQLVSCPQSVVATMPAGSGGRAVLTLSKPVTSAVTAHARIEMDVILPKAVTGGSTFLLLFANNDAAGSGVGFDWAGGQWYVRLRASGTQKTINPRIGTWNHIALDVTFSSANNLGKVDLSYTDASGTPQTTSITDSTLPGGTAAITTVAFTAGILPFGSVSAEMMAFMDDVVFTPQ